VLRFGWDLKFLVEIEHGRFSLKKLPMKAVGAIHSAMCIIMEQLVSSALILVD
jgi:hypothetical protein